MENKIRPIRRFVLVLDDPPDHVECGVVVLRGIGRRANLDYVVVRVGEDENVDFGQGDRVPDGVIESYRTRDVRD